MGNIIEKSRVPLLYAKIGMIVVWLSNLAHTDALFSVYALCAALAVIITFSKRDHTDSRTARHRIGMTILSVVFSGIVILSNYHLYTVASDAAIVSDSLGPMIDLGLSFIGGVIVAYPILEAFHDRISQADVVSFRTKGDKSYRIFSACVLLSLIVIHGLHFFTCEYPGNITYDTFAQIDEMVSGEYTNFCSFWHTLILQLFMSIGYALFGQMHAAAATACVIQALILILAFWYCLNTLYLSGVPKFWLAVSYVVLGLLPYNIALGITPWKDVLFAAGCLLYCSALFRILKNVHSSKLLNHIVLVLGGLLFCLSRNNGFATFGCCFVLFLVFLHKRKHLLPMGLSAAVLALCIFLNGPALSMLGVPGLDYVEGLSIPLQQISRVVVDRNELTEEEEYLISQVLDLDEIPELYECWLSDPIKVEFRENDDGYFMNNLDDYLELWFELGAKYPDSYVKAWIDQTKGYWNGGYDYFLYTEEITENPYGLEKAGQFTILSKLYWLYFGVSRHLIFFEPLHSIGLHVWIVFLVFLFCVLRRREEAVLCIPAIVITVSLWFGTPVYASFRYVYPLFVCFPLILTTAIFNCQKPAGPQVLGEAELTAE